MKRWLKGGSWWFHSLLVLVVFSTVVSHTLFSSSFLFHFLPVVSLLNRSLSLLAFVRGMEASLLSLGWPTVIAQGVLSLSDRLLDTSNDVSRSYEESSPSTSASTLFSRILDSQVADIRLCFSFSLRLDLLYVFLISHRKHLCSRFSLSRHEKYLVTFYDAHLF